MNTKKIYFLDLQTTGAKPPESTILEMAWGSYFDTEVTSYLFKQDNPIPSTIQILTGITESDLSRAIDPAEALDQFHKYLSLETDPRPTVIIHFANFEKKFLQDLYQKLGQEIPFDILCTHEVAKHVLPNLPNRGIKGLAGYFGYPSTDFKRATQQVLATQAIWHGLQKHLTTVSEQLSETLDPSQIAAWLNEKPKAKRGKYEYPLNKDKRLRLQKKPGIYRMISQWGEVLYVGKATSLHDRVNSYFRGQKNRDSRKLEMLTQVWDLDVTAVETPLEAAILEADEIKRLNPRYNISLKVGSRKLAFYNQDFSSVCTKSDSEHYIGPFPNRMTLDSMLRLRKSLLEDAWDPNMFYEILSPELILEGFNIFCSRHAWQADTFKNFRSILTAGLQLNRKLVDLPEDSSDQEELDYLNEGDLDSSLDLAESNLENPLELELTAEDLADKFERHFIRAANAYIRTKEITRLLNSRSEIKKNHYIQIQDGFMIDSTATWTAKRGTWIDHSVATYDRMTVLLSELNKIKNL